ncbi:hypothetical protein GGR56DRAFT_675832 [Xylariaceae sp. FL0804]|nr:hypothetical protein GGR56DRAFT_675832 [Xylariaceae sp. FL0804]
MVMVAFSMLFNTIGAQHRPLFECIILFLYAAGFVAILVPLWDLAPKAPTRAVLTSFKQVGGWGSLGAAYVVGQLTATGSLGGSASPAHMVEEVHDAAVVVPRMMVATIAINGVLGLVMIVTFCFCTTDLPRMIWKSTSAFPYVGVFHEAVDSSVAGTIAMLSVVTRLGVCGNLSGLPFSGWLRRLTVVGNPVPLRALFVSLTLTVALSLLNLGSPTALNSIVGLLSGSGGGSYTISIGAFR